MLWERNGSGAPGLSETAWLPSSVTLPSEGQKTLSNDHYFAVDVTHHDGSRWRVWRRYSDFDGLHRDVGRIVFNDAPFPCKTGLFGFFVRCEGAKLAKRRWHLELWLQHILAHPFSQRGGRWHPRIRAFMDMGRRALAPTVPPRLDSTPPRASVGQVSELSAVPEPFEHGSVSDAVDRPSDLEKPQDPLRAHSFPDAETSASSTLSPEVVLDDWADLHMIDVVVPEGLAEGETFGVSINGKEVHLEVPQGTSGGSELRLWYDVQAGTLTPVNSSPRCLEWVQLEL